MTNLRLKAMGATIMQSPYKTVTSALLASIAAGLLAANPIAAQQAPWTQYRGLQTLDIPFANGPIAMDRVPQVWLKLRGSRPARFGMDTGSTGIVVAAEHFTPGPNDIAEGPGRLIYNSSGRILNGERYTTEVEIQRDEYTPVATARVQVLRVSNITCLERARDCRPENNPRGVAFMGVGFATAPARRAPSPACRAIPSSAWSRSPRARRSRRCGQAIS
jgi:hypothetical protein